MKQQLIDEINFELNSMLLIISDVEYLIMEVGNKTPNNIQITALGGLVSQFYNGVENILKRIHKNFNCELPKGEDWHIALLDRFSSDSDFQIPIKLTKELIEKITDYRRFRHYFFHGYSHNLNWEILSNGAKDIREVLDQFVDELRKYGL